MTVAITRNFAARPRAQPELLTPPVLEHPASATGRPKPDYGSDMTRPRRSLRSALIRPVIGVIGKKKRSQSPEATLRNAAELALRPHPFAPSPRTMKGVDVAARRINGWPVYTITPRTPVRQHALFAHGGSFVHEISPWHWRMVASLAARTGTEFTVPIYPLIPFGTAREVVDGFTDLATAIVERAGAAKTVLIGDSAGGTIALATAMQLRDRGIPAPRDLVLISPAVDLTFSDPLIERIAPKDPWLAVPGLKALAEKWRGELPLTNPAVSPINGSLAGIGRITLFTGTHDILHADAAALARAAAASGHPLDLHLAPNMLHNYPVLPIPEGAAARRVIEGVLLRN